MKQLPLKAQLIAAFGVVCALLAVSAAVALSQSAVQRSAGSDLARLNAVTGEVQQLNYYNADMAGRQVGFAWEVRRLGHKAATNNDIVRRGYLQDRATVEKLLATFPVTALTAAERALLSDMRTRFAAYQTEDAQLFAMYQQPTSSLATADQRLLVVLNIPNGYYLKLITDTHQLMASLNARALTANRRDQSAASTATTMIIGIGAIALLTAIGALLLLIRVIRSRLHPVLDSVRSLQDHCTNDLQEALQALATGDLTRTVTPVTPPLADPVRDEIGELARAVEEIRARTVATVEAYNNAISGLRETVGEVAQTASSVDSSSRQVAETSTETGKATGEVAHAVGEVAHGAERQVQMIESAKHAAEVAEDVARAVNESAENATQAAEGAQQTRKVAQEGIGAAAQADEAMRSVTDSSQAVSDAIRQLAGKSDQIGAIVATITGIAEQTNLLALNAAIEAARAGEQGRGFAVVAEEVRKLAEESQHAAHEISVLIGAIQSDTTKVVSVVEDGAKRTKDGASVVETRQAFQRIETSVDDMTARIEQIATASQQIAASATSMQEHIGEVAEVAEQSSASTEEVSASTEQTSASAEQISVSAQELSGNADTLKRLMAKFKLTT
ncbi:MAG: HAMP domain-containing methyl-accepting chemotaxis protein [Solirubrobacteraceae bacterium]